MTTRRPVTMTDVYAAGLCATGARTFFNRYYDKATFKRFLDEGLPPEEVEALQDNAIAEKVLEAYRGRE